MRIREVEIRYKSAQTVTAAAAVVSAPKQVYDFVSDKIGDRTTENFLVLHLNNKNAIVSWQIVSMGTVSEAVVHPREVFRAAVMAGASTIIICHNHPSGMTTPSAEDLATTSRLIEVGKILGISVLDHIIVGDGEFCSLRETTTIFK